MIGKCKAPNTCVCKYEHCCIECPENDILIAKLYACCGNQEEFPREPITIDTNKMSELLEGVFIKAGLLEVE